MSIEIANQETKIDKLLELKEKLEENLWFYKGFIKVGEVAAFSIMFGLFGDNPSLYRGGVVLGAACIMLDFVLSYNDYCNQKRFERLIDE
jgi:hypothetical protein